MYPHQVFFLESRTDDDPPFESYNTNLVHVRVAKFVEGLKYDFVKTETLNPVVMSFDKTKDTVADIEQKIAQTLGMDPEQTIMLLKHENIMNDEVRTEFFNMDWRRKQTLAEG